ncbi:helix-turn-helix transcriptional regulator [Streptomyces luomodiensis]|uniref:Helix-turn-helix transcriptional regulator n=1 Tax=Streptomyces luomodiensis TaxID=3026192 RepID=A0ABY9USZ2_9ACTN|nr:helix-turn-helix transcriptional regulator [Streptomyces sp. SCA4-21]WNE95672.1 helix-turn-helix transcriptional regulator [Streptomyces sp. SCA4-21]
MDNALGDFLRARRELVTPAEAGLPAGHGPRRVPGLRREEVAMLAGISVEYYLRLEQGRDRNPSAQVSHALADVLQLDAEGTAYLMSLAGPKPSRRPDRADARVPESLGLLLRTLNVPAMVFNKYSDVLAANRLARALAPDMEPGTNRLRTLFTEQAAHDYHDDWERYTATAVAHLRAQIGTETDDARLHTLIGELSVKSERFRVLWARHDVRTARDTTFRIRHPTIGPVELLVEKFQVAGSDGLETLLLHAAPGSPSADALALLASLDAS